jgi:hypothetical protein
MMNDKRDRRVVLDILNFLYSFSLLFSWAIR